MPHRSRFHSHFRSRLRFHLSLRLHSCASSPSRSCSRLSSRLRLHSDVSRATFPNASPKASPGPLSYASRNVFPHALSNAFLGALLLLLEISLPLFCMTSIASYASESKLADESRLASPGSRAGEISPETSELPSTSGAFFENFRNAPRSFTLMPFWFWNDALDDAEIVRQIADFEAHGVYGFVIHPRIGLPEDFGWTSPKLLAAMRVALTEARRRGMFVLLYDEGMYPSGSSAGQVAARNPRFAARGLFMKELADCEEEAPLNPEPLWDLIATRTRPNGKRIAIYERPSNGVIRGLHYLDEGSPQMREQLPPAGDILNPDAVACFQELVYERFFTEFGEFFGSTVVGIFTDEPSELGRNPERGVVPGNAGALLRVSQKLGYDFSPFLADLWFADEPESLDRRGAYYRALHQVLVETYYGTLAKWCEDHEIALCGHPANSNDMASESVFQIPGQDIVWRYLEPGPKALHGPHSTNAKVASSAMTNYGRSRNLNELYGAYGHDLTFEEVEWLARWTLVRGQNLLVPHAFYYSIRGPRHDERPPDVGPNSPWWDRFKPFADACRRLCWINSGKPIVHVAVLTDGVAAPDACCVPLFENQLDFNYVLLDQLLQNGSADENGLKLADMTYRALILPTMDDAVPEGFWESKTVKRLKEDGRLVAWNDSDPAEFVDRIRNLVAEIPNPDVVRLTGKNVAAMRMRQVLIDGTLCVLLFNEEDQPVSICLSNVPEGPRFWLDPQSGAFQKCESLENVAFQKFEMKLLAIPTTD